MLNRKIKNAHAVKIDGITFKSKLEGSVYNLLKENNIPAKYEAEKIKLLQKFKPMRGNYYLPNRNKELKLSKIVREMTYTPDFKIQFGNNLVFIEVKGYRNDSFPIKEKLFIKYLEDLKFDGNIYYFRVHNKEQTLNAINLIKNL